MGDMIISKGQDQRLGGTEAAPYKWWVITFGIDMFYLPGIGPTRAADPHSRKIRPEA